MSSHTHSHDGRSHSHSHAHAHDGGTHGHSHEILDGPGSYLNREMPLIEGRDWKERAFTIGIGGLVLSVPLFFCLSLQASKQAAGVANKRRAFRLTVAPRPVGSGKTALMLALSLALRDEYSIAAVTNDIFTRYVMTRIYSFHPTSKGKKRKERKKE